MANTFTGVFPVYSLQPKIKVAEEFVEVAEMATIAISIDGGIESWNPIEAQGWAKHLMTSKSITYTMNGKRSIGDKGNDYIAGLAWKSGRDVETQLQITFPDGATLTNDVIVNVTSIAGADSTNVAPLEFTMQGNGKPTYTPASSETH